MPGLEDLAALMGTPQPEKKKTDTKKRGYDGQVMRIRVRMEKRRGSPVTIAWGFQSKPADLKDLLSACRKKLGTGGVVTDNQLEMQGDHVDRVIEIIKEAGYSVGK